MKIYRKELFWIVAVLLLAVSLNRGVESDLANSSADSYEISSGPQKVTKYDNGAIFWDSVVYQNESSGFLSVSDWDLHDNTSIFVLINSTSDPTGFLFEIFPYGSPSTDWYTFVTFTMQAPSYGELLVADGDIIMASYSDNETTSGAVEIRRATAMWYSNMDASILAYQDSFNSSIAYVEVVDQPEDFFSIDVRVNSSSDPTGFDLTLPGSSGYFYTEFYGGSSTNAFLNILQVTGGDTVWVTYDDPRLSSGVVGTVSTSFEWSSGGGSFTMDPYLWIGDSYHTLYDIGIIDVFAPILDLNPSVVESYLVHIWSDTDSVGIDVPVQSFYAIDQYFYGEFNFSIDASNNQTDTLLVSDCDHIYGSLSVYINETFGTFSLREDEVATWCAFDTGFLFLTSDFYSSMYNYVPESSISVQVQDLDQNLNPNVIDSIQVKVNSTADPTGFTLTLLESDYLSLPSPNTGMFTGNFSFVDSGTSNANSRELRIFDTVLAVEDTFWVTYLDDHPCMCDESPMITSGILSSETTTTPTSVSYTTTEVSETTASLGTGTGTGLEETSTETTPVTESTNAPTPGLTSGFEILLVLSSIALIIAIRYRNSRR